MWQAVLIGGIQINGLVRYVTEWNDMDVASVKHREGVPDWRTDLVEHVQQRVKERRSPENVPARASAAFILQIFKLQDKPEVQPSMYLGMYSAGKKDYQQTESYWNPAR